MLAPQLAGGCQTQYVSGAVAVLAAWQQEGPRSNAGAQKRTDGGEEGQQVREGETAVWKVTSSADRLAASRSALCQGLLQCVCCQEAEHGSRTSTGGD